MQWGRWLFLLAVCLLTAFISCAASAQYTPRIEAGVSKTKGQVIINGKVALTFTTPNGNLGPSERAKTTAERIAAYIDSGKSPIYIYGKGDKTSAKVVADDTLLCMVTAADAKNNKSMPLDLANAWAKNIRSLLLMPPVVLSQNEITVPLGENRRVSVGGTYDGAITANVHDTSVANATPSDQTREVVVLGLQTGVTFVDISVNNEIVMLRVNVKKYAGALIQPQTETVITGEPCPKGVVQDAFDRAIVRAFITEPGTQLEILSKSKIASDLGAGKNVMASAKVRITGPGYISYSGAVTIVIKNELLNHAKPDFLFYSNNPERVLNPQVLFAGKMSSQNNTRLLYHHQNDSGKKLRFTVEIINIDLSPAVVRIFPGEAAISVDTVVVGYSAGRSFLTNYTKNVSIIDPIPPQTKLTLISQIVKQGETASGILELSQMFGEDAYVIVRASDPTSSNVASGSLTKAPEQAPWNISTHIYATPQKALEETFEIGKQWKFISVGKFAIQSSDTQRKLDGNYGVSYHINLKVKNPLPDKGKVSILFDATAGLASVISLVNGQLVGEKYVKPPNEAHLASYTLEPGEEKDVRIVFIPLAGSNYPAKIVVKS